MKFSKTTEYALRILCYMAQDTNRLYPAGFLVETLQISDKYLRRLMTNLSKAGFIRSTHGRDGGYSFRKQPSQIFLWEIIDSVEGFDKYMECVLGFKTCSDDNPCALHNLWVQTRDQFKNSFLTSTLADLDFDVTMKF